MGRTWMSVGAGLTAIAAALCGVWACARPAQTGRAQARSATQARLGMNLNGPADWNTELPFVDVFRLSRQWVSQREGQPWGSGPKLDLDERGWVKRLEPGCFAETPICTIEGGHYPSGDYALLYDGSGTLEAWGAATVKSRAPGRVILTVDAKKGGFFVRLRETDVANPVRNIRCVMPGFEATYRTEPFHPVFLKRWGGIACLRFMDWMLTNGSTQAKWSDRPRPDDATFTTKGVPVEVMVDLCNRLKADAWFCMPHLADDDYVRRFAQVVKERLAPGLKVYVEYSNEVWNGQFEQSRWAGKEGVRLGFAEKEWEGAWRYTAFRSTQAFAIWTDVFGGTARLVRVLPSQAANAYVSEQVVSFRDAYKQADALAIAPYVTCNVSPTGKPGAAEVAGWTADQALDYMERTALAESAKWIEDSKKVADKYGLRLVAYEGGQHMVGVGGAENNEALTRLLQAANRHPRMAQVYERYFDAWARAGGLFCYFASTGGWSKWGSWGILEHYDSDPSASPKYQAALAWARKQGQAMTGR